MNISIVSRKQMNNDKLVLTMVKTIIEKRHSPLTVFQISRILQQYNIIVDIEDNWATGSQTRKLQAIMNDNTTSVHHMKTDKMFILLDDNTFTLPYIHQMLKTANQFLIADLYLRKKTHVH